MNRVQHLGRLRSDEPTTPRWRGAVVRFLLFACFFPVAAQADEPTDVTGPGSLTRIESEFTGDLPEIEKRRLLRILISSSRTDYFVDFGTERGLEFELLRKYKVHINTSDMAYTDFYSNNLKRQLEIRSVESAQKN